MFERGPITMRLRSPRSTAPYQTLDSSSRITSPITVAPGTTHALEWMVGLFLRRAAIPACPVGSVSVVTCMVTINLQRPIRLRKATARLALNVQPSFAEATAWEAPNGRIPLYRTSGEQQCGGDKHCK